MVAALMTLIMGRINYEYKGPHQFKITRGGQLQVDQAEDTSQVSSLLMGRVKIINETHEQ